MKKRFQDFINDLKYVLSKIQTSVIAGQLAFFLVLSIVPILTLIAYAAGALNLSIEYIKEFVEKIFSDDVVSLIVPAIAYTKINFKTILLLTVGLYVASNGTKSIIIASNTIYNINDRNLIKRRIKALFMTGILILLFLFMLIVPAFGNNIISAISKLDIENDLIKRIQLIFSLMKGPFTWFVIFILIKLIYTMAPDKKISSSYVNVGSLFTTIGWSFATWIFSRYVSDIADYTILYSGLSNIVILMLWIYLLCTIFVIGLALNYRKEEVDLAKTGQIKIK